MVPAMSDEYALPLPLAMPALAEEITRTSEVSKVPVPKTVKLKKPASEVDQLTKEMQKLSISYVTPEEMQKAVNASAAAVTDKMQSQYQSVLSAINNLGEGASGYYGGRGGFGGRGRGRGGYYSRRGGGAFTLTGGDRPYPDSQQNVAQVNAAYQSFDRHCLACFSRDRDGAIDPNYEHTHSNDYPLL
jgi:hypothetical protein